MESTVNESGFNQRLSGFVGKFGLLIGILLAPPLFSKIFAIGELLARESSRLWLFFAIVICLSVFFLIKKKTVSPGKSLLWFSVLLLVSVELIFRLYAHFLFPFERKKQLTDECNYTYPEFTAYTAHPFLQFTGRPSVMLQGSRALSGVSVFNNMGFVGADFKYEKPYNFIRVACLGESTTADGWPGDLEKYLNASRPNDKVRYEVMNFAHAYWTSAHGAINMLLNITDFNPDYIVIHHGWNENLVRDAEPGTFRGDYFHDLKVMTDPVIYDKYPLRASLIYRVLKFKYNPKPEWMSLNGRVHNDRKHVNPQFRNLDELKPYRRNIEAIINIALFHRIKVIMTTIPRSTDPAIDLSYTAVSLDQCNAINRELARKYPDQVVLIDLDSMITGKRNEIFTDLAHINDDGRALKGKLVGEVLLASTHEMAEQIGTKIDPVVVRKNDIDFYESRIKTNPKWLNDEKDKAAQRKISLEEMINIDAEWLYAQDSIKRSETKKQGTHLLFYLFR